MALPGTPKGSSAMRPAIVCCGVLGLVLSGCAADRAGGPDGDPTVGALPTDPAPAMLASTGDAPVLVAGGVSPSDQPRLSSASSWWRPVLTRADSVLDTLAGMNPGDGFAPSDEETASGMGAWPWQALASTHLDRAVRATQLHTGGPGARRVYLIAGIHGSEPEGRRALDLIAAELESAARSADITLRIIDDANPDGTARRQRTNSRGVDLNRNWPAQNFLPGAERGPSPLSEPETQAIAADLDAFAPDLVIVLHSINSGPFVNYDGPAVAVAGAFADAALHADQRWRVVPNMGYPTPGSLGSYLGQDRGIAIITIEFKRGQSARSAANALRLGLPEVFAAISSPR